VKLKHVYGGLLLACLATPGTAMAWKFVVMGDTRGSNNGVNTTAVSSLANAIVAEGAKFTLVVGDLVDSGNLSYFNTWKSTMSPVYNAGIGVYPIRGNHDVESSGAWATAFGNGLPQNGPAGELGKTYSFNYNNAFIVGLDEYTTSHQVNQPWLNGQFAANNQPHVFVFGHEPAFKFNHTDCLDDYQTNRNTFWNSIAAEGGRSYFCGHDHLYAHARIDDGDGNPNDDLQQFITGNGGAPWHTSGTYDGANSPFSPVPVFSDLNQRYGYAVVEINGLDATITYKAQPSGGGAFTVYDSFSYTAVPEPVTMLLLALGGVMLTRRSR
jgi:predicted phosphodiesterase